MWHPGKKIYIIFIFNVKKNIFGVNSEEFYFQMEQNKNRFQFLLNQLVQDFFKTKIYIQVTNNKNQNNNDFFKFKLN